MLNLQFLNTVFILFTLAFSSLNSQVIYVKPDGNGNGSSWAQAKGDLRQALVDAPKGSQIWVAKGIYTPTICTVCSDVHRRFSFEILDSVSVYGGFSGTETRLNQRDWKTNQTVLSGNIDRDTTLKNNSFNVIYTQNVSKAMVLDGFTISNGNANDTITSGERTTSGGGWYNDARQTGYFGNPSVRNCIFQNNHAGAFGGAIMNNGGFGGKCEASFVQCQFINNTSGVEGGAVRNSGVFSGLCNPTFSFCQFSNNHGGAAGGAVFNDGVYGICNPTFTNCRFDHNITDTYGGGMYNLGKTGLCSPIITNCLFWANKAFSAAGVYCLGSEKGNSSPRITNSIFYKNEANTCGSVYANANDTTGKAAPTILNCIIWGNIATTAPYIRSIESAPFLDYSIIDAPNATAVFLNNINGHGVCGSHVIYNQNPFFADPDKGDFRIVPPSPAINTGLDSAAINAGLLVDIDSLPRIVGSHIDIGILEYNPALYFPPRLEQSPVNMTVCEQEKTVLKAMFSGSPPLYFQWYKNGILLPNETNDSLKFVNGITLSDSGTYKCIARNSLNIKDSTASSTIRTKPILPLSIGIQSNRIATCEGDSITLSSAWENGGIRPKFDWRLNGNPLGLDDTLNTIKQVYSSMWFRYTCRVTSSKQCALPRTAESNEIQYPNVVPLDTAALTLTKVTSGTLCSGDFVEFSTTAKQAGATPQYQWYRNNTLLINNLGSLRINNLTNNDTLKVVMTSSQKCLVKNPVESNKIVTTITPRTSVSVQTNATKTDICVGDTVTINATPIGGGATPQYQWLLNGVNIGGANAFFHKTNTLRNGDKLRVQMFSSAVCPSASPVLSDEIAIKVNDLLTPNIALATLKLELCLKEKITFTTVSSALGTTPQYQWLRNGLTINNLNSSYSTDSLRKGDTIWVVATSSERCLTTPKAVSNKLVPIVNLCNDIVEGFEKQVTISPNPSTESRFTFTGLDAIQGEKTVSVFNAHGQLIFSKNIKTEEKESVLDIKTLLPNGMYWVKIATNDGHFYKKWVLEK